MQSRPPQTYRSHLPALENPRNPLGEFRRKTKRMFFGLELPPSFQTQLAELNPRLRNVRWVSPEQMHLTLSFLGNVTAEQELALEEAVDQIKVGPFFVPVRNLGTFGGKRPTILWAGVGNGHPHLFALHKHVQDAVLRAGSEPDLRAFHPHITLARMEGVSSEMLAPFLRQNADAEFGLLPVKEFVLFSSQRTPSGSTYRVEKRFALE